MQALKSLFNIAHCLGGLLGASWNLVLATLEQARPLVTPPSSAGAPHLPRLAARSQLDRIIASSKSHGAHGSEAAFATSPEPEPRP